jgi:hypothetical protein
VKLLTLCTLALSGSLIVSGCAGKEEAVPINLTLKPVSEAGVSAPASNVTVIVTPFADDRSDRTKLGVHQSFWGTSHPVTLKNGTVGEVTATALAEYLTRKGWHAKYVPGATGVSAGDVVISGKVLESAVDAQGTVGSTEIAAKQKIVLHAKNQADGSSITDTVSHHGTYSVFWFDGEDAEEILREVMEKNFDKFVSQTRFEGSALRFRQS